MSALRLEDHVALVTGGAQGLGHALAIGLARQGATVVIADVADCTQRLGALPADLRDRIAYRKTDVRSEQDVRATVQHIVEQYDRIDILVNNAAIFSSLQRKPLDELETADWESVFAVNVFGSFHCIKAVVPHMKAQGRGRIINVVSNVVFKGLPMLLHYVASKGAVFAMTRAAARELGPDNITVNAVAPGYMRHPDFAGWDPRRDEQVRALRSLDRTQSPEDVVGSVVFLASNEADFLTGQTLVVDGGEVFH